MKYLNLGCGLRYHHDWINLDYRSTSAQVLSHNLLQGIPYPNDVIDVVYHSHVLEHFSRSDAKNFLQECYRVLCPGGILRVVVPDLERIVRAYLIALEGAISGYVDSRSKHEWMTIELMDQMVRERPGGEMAAYFRQENPPNLEFVLERIGVEGRRLLGKGYKDNIAISAEKRAFSLHNLRRLARNLLGPKIIRERFLQKILGGEYAALQLGRFRMSGEVHKWMYDRYSLKSLLAQAGFINVTETSSIVSKIPDWPRYNLDTEPDGTAYKPDSLYMEAVKP